MLVVAHDTRVLERGLEEGVQHMEAGFIGREEGAPGGHAAERTHCNVPVGLAVPRAAPVLHLDQLRGGLGHERLDHVLVRQVVAALDGVESVPVQGVTGAQRGRCAALRRDRVAAHGIDLGDQGHPQAVAGLDGGDGRAQPRGAPADNDDVVLDNVHLYLSLRPVGKRRSEGGRALPPSAFRPPPCVPGSRSSVPAAPSAPAMAVP